MFVSLHILHSLLLYFQPPCIVSIVISITPFVIYSSTPCLICFSSLSFQPFPTPHHHAFICISIYVTPSFLYSADQYLHLSPAFSLPAFSIHLEHVSVWFVVSITPSLLYSSPPCHYLSFPLSHSFLSLFLTTMYLSVSTYISLPLFFIHCPCLPISLRSLTSSFFCSPPPAVAQSVERGTRNTDDPGSSPGEHTISTKSYLPFTQSLDILGYQDPLSFKYRSGSLSISSSLSSSVSI